MKNKMISKVKCILIATLVSSFMVACGNNGEYTKAGKDNEETMLFIANTMKWSTFSFIPECVYQSFAD